jgi:hypothetical protein
MSRVLKPWAYAPFEVLLHAETHYRAGEDLDRRIAMIGYDNSIEVSITIYLSLYPIQRGNREYASEDVNKWLNSYHSKIGFFFLECASRNLVVIAKEDEILWFHKVRNDQYHVGGATVPQHRELDAVRAAAMEVFSVLFDEVDVSTLLEEYLAEMTPPPPPPRTEKHDRLIDGLYGMVDLCGQPEYTSELLYALDPSRYRDLALELQAGLDQPNETETPS